MMHVYERETELILSVAFICHSFSGLASALRKASLAAMADPLEIKYAALKDEGIRAFMIAGERFYPADAVNFTLAQQREFYDTYCANFRKPRPAGIIAEDFFVGSVPCRHYRPKAEKNYPVMLYLHGGGYMLGGLDSHDDVCAEISDQADVAVVGVQYRLAPEHPFPAALDDAWAVLQYLSQNHARIVVGGDSAGGNLSAALALKARDEGGPKISGQVLIYPGLGGDPASGSYITQANAPGLTTKDVLYYRDVYKGGSHKYAEPLRETNFKNLPPAFMVAAELDPLCDDCKNYAAKLRQANVSVQVRHEPLLVHAFLRARHMSEPARASFSAIGDAARRFAYSPT
jgi:acetyl esterase